MTAPKLDNGESPRPPMALIGTGPVSRSLGWAICHAGYPISAVIGLELEQARNMRRQLGADIASTSVAAIPNRTRIFVLAVTDDRIVAVAERLVELDFLDKACTAIHCSGALPASVMAPLQAFGVSLMSFHPMMAFPRGSRKRSLRGISIGIEGNSQAVQLGMRIARDIGAIPVEIPTEWKTTYHLAGVWASNFLVGLISQAASLMDEISRDGNKSLQILEPLIQGTIDQIKRTGIEGALTGPAMRGDIGTIQKHLEILSSQHPEYAEIYRLMTNYIIRTLVKDPGDNHRRILHLLEDH